MEAFILNEKAVKEFGWASPAAAIGKQFEREGKKGRVVGVVQDFHFRSFREPIEALVLDVWAPIFTVFSVRISAHNVLATIAFVRETWGKFFPEKVFDYSLGFCLPGIHRLGSFAIAGSIALLIALLTVSFQAVKAAVANPIKSLRTE